MAIEMKQRARAIRDARRRGAVPMQLGKRRPEAIFAAHGGTFGSIASAATAASPPTKCLTRLPVQHSPASASWRSVAFTFRQAGRASRGGAPGHDLIRLVEEVLPAQFGGGPTDYQFVEV